MESEARILTTPYHHGLKPFAEFDHKFGDLRASFFTNSLGFRDASTRDVSLKKKGRRVLLIGDSITEGVGYTYEQTFAGIIEKELRKKNIETLNAAVQSYAHQTYAHQIYYTKVVHFLETIKLEVSDVVVFLDIGDVANDATQYKIDDKGNVVRRNPNCRYGIGCIYPPLKRFKFWLKGNSIIYRAYKLFKAAKKETKMRGNIDPYIAAVKAISGSWTLPGKEYDAFGEIGLKVASEAMTKLNQFLTRKKINLTVVVYPWPFQIAKMDIDSLQVRFWRDWAEKTDSGFINLFPYFFDARDPKIVYQEYFIPFDIHFNGKGHELVAAKFLDQFQ